MSNDDDVTYLKHSDRKRALSQLRIIINQLATVTLLASLGMQYAAAENAPLERNKHEQTTTQMSHHDNGAQQPTQSKTVPIGQAIDTAISQGLAYHPAWLRLHYYQKQKGHQQTISFDSTAATKRHNRSQAKIASGYLSEVTESSFFLSDQGRSDPEAELIATLKAIINNEHSQTLNKGQSILCQFPARTHWLASQLQLKIEQPDCPELDAWQQKLDAERLSVLFAEEYLDNPLSAFGHTLLLIESTATVNNPTDIDKSYALNATVGGDAGDSLVKYGLKSMLGGYPIDVTIDPYPEKLAYYVQGDNRDVWTYPLALTDSEVQQIMRHIWETKDIELPYYFTKDNCASEILRYIDIVRPSTNLVDKLSLAVVPSDIIRLLKAEGFINSPHYIPADDTLAQAQRNMPNRKDLTDSSISKDDKFIATDLIPTDNNPLNAHPIQRAIVGIGHQDDTSYVSLAYRGVFNDLLDRPNGYPENFDLNGMALELRAYENTEGTASHEHVELESLTLLRGRSFNPINTAQRGDSKLSTWGVSLGAEQVKDGSEKHSDSHLVGSATYEKGLSYALGTPKSGSGQLPPHLCYAMGAGTAQVGKGINHGYRVGVGANLGCRYQVSPKSRIIGEVQLPYWYHGDINNIESAASGHYWQPIMSVGAQYDLDRNQAIRLNGSYQFLDRVEEQQSIQLSYVKYF